MYLKTDGGLTVLKENYTFADFRADFPNTHLAKVEPARTQFLATQNIFPVTILDKPAYNEATQLVELNAASTWNAGLSRWERDWTIRAMTPQELVARAIRKFDQDAVTTLSNFSTNDIIALSLLYSEVKTVRAAVAAGAVIGNLDVPLVDAVNAVFPGQTRVQIATTVENKCQSIFVNLVTALAKKIKDGGL